MPKVTITNEETGESKEYKLGYGANLRKSAYYAKKLGLEVHAGHGLTYKSAYHIAKIKNISEFNIGHFIVSESLFVGIKNSIKKFNKIINR